MPPCHGGDTADTGGISPKPPPRPFCMNRNITRFCNNKHCCRLLVSRHFGDLASACTSVPTSVSAPNMSQQIIYSDKYNDDQFEYRYQARFALSSLLWTSHHHLTFPHCRHVILPKHLAKKLPPRLLTETEWRAIGVQQSPGWEHYERHDPEPHILLFRRSLDHPYATKPSLKTAAAH